MCRIVVDDSGLQRCGPHRSSHSWARGVRWSTPPAAAVDPAAAQLGVERVERLDAQRAGLLLAQERTNVLLQVLRVHGVRRGTDVERLQVPVEQLVQRRVRARVPTFVDLAGEPAHRLLGLGAALGPGGMTSRR